ncbi:MAG: M28 family peptidase [Candidatus Hydrothermae bacterium]|nr:M28 family peptidase [Candidatus Hydrothermae bacterium]
MLKILFVLFLVRTPLYYVYDPLGKGIEPLLKNDGIKIVKKVDKYTWLVEGDLEKVNTGIYRIARYFEPKGKIAPLDIKTPDIHWDPFIDSVLSTISLDSLKATIQRLQDFKTRYAYTDSCRAAEEWLKNKISTYVDSSILWSFEYNGTWMRNVIGYKAGSMDEFVMITSHLDAITYADPYNVAPGADDNASGTAVVMEAARILKGIETGTSIRFVPFTAEELGLIGSEHYADYIYTNNESLLATLNFDMVGYQTNDGKDFEIYGDSSSLAYKIMTQVAQIYTNTNNSYFPRFFGGSDHAPFAEYGYPWAFVIESSYYLNPNYHNASDLITTLNDSLLLNAAKIGIGTLLYFALYPYPPQNFIALDVGTGDSIIVKWSKHPWNNVTYYTLYIGTAHDVYTDTLVLTDTLIGLGNLTEGTTYYFRIQANTNERNGFLSEEISATPQHIPLAPTVSRIDPTPENIQIVWYKNQELDIVGYNIYRRLEEENSFIKVNVSPLADTFLVDAEATQPIWYYYYITAVDGDGFESAPSCTLTARPVTLSEGIAIIDEFKEGDGTPFSPNQAMQKAFLDTIFGEFTYTLYNADSVDITISQIGIHKLIYLFSDDYAERKASAFREAIKKYTSYGGKLIITGWEISSNLLGAIYNDYIADTVLRLPVDTIYLNPNLDFISAIPLSSFPSLELDTVKIPSRYNNTLRYIETFHLNDGFPIYTFNSSTDDPQWEGKICGFMTPDSSIIYLGFPLYYIRSSQARSFIYTAIANLTKADEAQPTESIKPFFSIRRDKLFYDMKKPYKKLTFNFYNVLGQRILTTRVERPSGFISLKGIRNSIIFVQVLNGSKVLATKKLLLLR